MSPYIFAKAIRDGRTIELYHHGKIRRDYTYIDDIVSGTLAILDKPSLAPAHRVYNLGATHTEEIAYVVSLFEKAFDRKANIELRPGEPSDMQETAADVSDTTRDFGWTPTMTIDQGIPSFVAWYKAYDLH